jgi:hypothetical protein
MKKTVLTLLCLIILATFSGVASASEYCTNPNIAFLDDHSNSYVGATGVRLPYTWISGKLECPGDQDWFRVDVTTPMNLGVRTYGSTDTYGYLYKMEKFTWKGYSFQYLKFIASNDDANYSLNFGIYKYVNSGVYYIMVRHYSSKGTGPYYLEVKNQKRIY